MLATAERRRVEGAPVLDRPEGPSGQLYMEDPKDQISATTSPEGEEPQGCGGKEYRTLYCAHCGAEIRVHVTCGDRTCPDCRKSESKRLRREYLPKVRLVDQTKLALITLTLRMDLGRHDDLRRRLDRIRTAWRKLVRQKPMRVVAGGLYTIEVKWTERQAWNVHIHALVEVEGIVRPFRIERNGRPGWAADLEGPAGRLSPQALSDAWRKLTGDSYIVDITPVRTWVKGGQNRGGARGALAYVLKYITKAGCWPGQWARDEYDRAVKGHRLINTFGTWTPHSRAYRFAELGQLERPSVACKVCGASVWIPDVLLWRLARRAMEVLPEIVHRERTKPGGVHTIGGQGVIAWV